MPSYNFADRYKAAGLTPSHEIIAARQLAIKELIEDANFALILDFTRLYFGLPVPNGAAWFRDAFGRTDNSFSLIDNEREVAVLSACALAEIIAAGKHLAALAPLVAAAGIARTPLSSSEFLEDARCELGGYEVKYRQFHLVDANNIKQTVKGKTVSDTIALISKNESFSDVAEAIKGVSGEAREINKALANQVLSVVQPLISQVQGLREEVDMLWWFVGGWSRLLSKPFAEMDIRTAAVMAGLDLAYLVKGDTGPVAAPALLHRLIVGAGATMSEKFTLQTVIDAMTDDVFSCIVIPEAISRVGDICPVLFALAKVKEIGDGTAWHTAFKKGTGLAPTIEFSPLEITMQVYRESLLVKLAN